MKRTLCSILRLLLKQHGAPTGPDIDDPFELILWEQVAYLASDDRRREAFELLESRLGLAPAAIARASPEPLTKIAAAGGAIASAERAERMRDSAQRVIAQWGGDLRAALRLPVKKALRALCEFPMIGKPGAEKILLLTRAQPLLALDANALRVLLRLGYGTEGKRYDQTYASVRAATASQERSDYHWLISLRRLLRRHGQRLCRRHEPDCASCSLRAMCASYDAQGAA